MKRQAVFVCREPQGDHWQLGPLDGSVDGPLLIGWRVDPTPVDAGLPPQVAQILARSLVHHFLVTCMSSTFSGTAEDGWTPSGSHFIRRLVGRRQSHHFFAGVPAHATLFATREPAAVVTMLNDACFPWTLQGQVALLSDPAVPPPPSFEPDGVEMLCCLSWWKSASAIEGLWGALRPGVDGDIAGVFVADADQRDSWLSSLKGECHASAFSFEILDNATFADRL
jgi:hypothetical protein